MYILFGDRGSGAFSAEAALAEAGAPHEMRLVSLETNEQHAPAFLALNPTGKMPAMKLPSGEIVTESLAILLTIDDRFASAKLLPPPGTDERARAYRWLAFLATEVYPMVEISDYPKRFAPAGPEAEALRDKARARIRQHVLRVENEIASPWFLGSAFSLLDIYAAMFSRWRGSLGAEWAAAGHMPKLDALAKSVSQRPRLAALWKRHFKND